MKKEEMILALQVILEDIRANTAFDTEVRLDIALKLSKLLSKEDKQYLIMIDTINEFIAQNGTCDGRFFREDFPYGYEEMENLHKLSNTYQDKSDYFKDTVSCLTYPENRFSDWSVN